MSVSDTVVLPGQPTTGQTVYSPLGGGGKFAPHLEILVEQILIGDASGGNKEMRIDLDPRYAQGISYLFGMNSAGAAVAFGFDIFRSDLTNVRQNVTAPSTNVSPNSWIWSPPALIISGTPGQAVPFCRLITPNVDGVNTTFSVQLFAFVKNVREITPLNVLYQSFPRIGSNGP